MKLLIIEQQGFTNSKGEKIVCKTEIKQVNIPIKLILAEFRSAYDIYLQEKELKKKNG